MKFYSIIAKKRLMAEKSEFFLLSITIAVATATLLMTFSLSANYLTFLVKNSQNITGGSFSQLLKSNLENLSEIGVYAGEFLIYLKTGVSEDLLSQEVENLEDLLPPQAENSESIFSPTASIENMPSTIFLLSAVVLFMVNTMVSIVFRVCRKSRRNFLITMLGSGDTMYGIKRYVCKETQYILIAGVPIGLFIGTAGVYTVRLFGKIYFENQKFSQFPVNINLSLLALAVTILIITLLTFKFSKKTYKDVTIKNVASALKTKLTVDNGIRSLTAKPKKYLKKGMGHFVSMANFSNNMMNYFGIIGTTSITLLVFTITIMVFDTVRNYNGMEILSCDSQIIEFSFASEIYFFAVAIVLAVVLIFAIFSSVFANITSNTGIYALMRSSGSDIGEIQRTVRKEGSLIALVSCITAVFASILIIFNSFAIFLSDSRVTFNGLWKIWLVIVSATLLVYVSVLTTTCFMRKKIKNLDMIGTLKNLFY